jgi:hypothetical protein
MGFMQSMQQSQQQMMQGMQQSQQQLMLQPRPATTLAALKDRSQRQAGMLGLEPPIRRQRTSPLFEEVTDSPPVKAPAPAVVEETTPDNTVLVFSAANEPAGDTEAPAPAHAAAVAQGPNTMDAAHAIVAVGTAAPTPTGRDIDELFGMLHDRTMMLR